MNTCPACKYTYGYDPDNDYELTEGEKFLAIQQEFLIVDEHTPYPNTTVQLLVCPKCSCVLARQ